MSRLKLLWLNIETKLLEILTKTILAFGWVFVGLIYVIIFGGILALFAIPIVFLLKLI
jgi:hypothetical protein